MFLTVFLVKKQFFYTALDFAFKPISQAISQMSPSSFKTNLFFVYKDV